MGKKIKRLLSSLLILTMLITIIPTEVFAISDNAAVTSQMPGISDEEITSDEQENVNVAKEITGDDIVGEIESSRSADTKHFKLRDGSYIAVKYDTNVHYKDSKGKWQDIDNQLIKSKSNLASSVESYNTQKNNLKTNISVNSGLENNINANYDKYNVSFNLIGAKNSTAELIDETTIKDDSLASALELPNISSSVIYNNILEDVDLLYTAHGNTIKESIIVSRVQDLYHYSFNMKLENLTPVLEKDGSISLIDNTNSEKIYIIPAPHMYDANGVISGDVSYVIEAKGNDEYILNITASESWINEKERQFPVTIDPTLILNIDNNNTEYTYVSSGAPTTNHNGWSALYLGYDSSGTYKNRVLFKVKNLPVLPENSVVVNASVLFSQKNYSFVGQSSMNVEAHELTSNVASIKDTTWNTQPSFNNEIADYSAVSSSTIGGYAEWNLTRMTKGWYENPSSNYGVVFMASNESTMTSSSCANASFYTGTDSNQTNPPIYVVQYRNNIGVEDYLSYQTQDIGRAGTGFVSDYSSQLTLIKDDATITGAIEFTLSHVYNSAYAIGNFPIAADNSANYSSMLMGYGWKLNAQQSVVPKTINNINYLIYTDGDGTEHYFVYNVDGYYYDEDGLGLKIQKAPISSPITYTMSDNKGNSIVFYNGLISIISDSSGNKVYFIYNNANEPITGTYWRPNGYYDKLLNIRQYNNGETGYINIASLSYSGNYLQSITDRAGNVTTYTYTTVGTTGKNLTTITHADSTTVKYTYKANTNKLVTALDSESLYSIGYGYNAITGKIDTIQEYANSVPGTYIGVNGNKNGITKYRNIGADKIISTSDDILTYYVFDYYGHTINKYSTNNDGKTVYGATADTFLSDPDKPKQKNRLGSTTSIGVASVNLLRYGGIESTDWNISGSGSLALASFSSAKVRTGQLSQQVTLLSGYTNTLSILQDKIALTAGKTYTLSAYVNTSQITNITGGVFFKVTDGTDTFTGDKFHSNTIESVEGGWKRISYTFTAIKSVDHIISVNYTGFVGTAYADDVQLEEGKAPGNVNLLNECNFDNGFGWEFINAGYSNEASLSGTTSVKITGSPNSARNAAQVVQINQSGKQTYVLSGWGKATSVPIIPNTNRVFGLRAIIEYSDGTTEPHDVSFNPDSTEWQFASVAIVPKQSSKTVLTIKVLCKYDNNANSAYFDNISLIRELAQTYKYDDNGNLTSVATTDNDEVSYSYEGADLIRSITSDSGTYVYGYDAAHRVSSVENNGITMALTYDAKGNTKTSTLKGTSGYEIKTSADYSDAGNLLDKTYDSRGFITQYTYDNLINKLAGLPSSITQAYDTTKALTTNYSYNAQNGRPDMSYMPGKISIVYQYTKGMLSAISRGGYITSGGVKQTQNYNFAHDDFGNLTSVSVGTTAGNHTLASYNYASGNGLLNSMSYGNGSSVTYTYDTLDRITSELYNDGKGYNYTYTGDGQLHQVKSLDGSESTVYRYDSIGRFLFKDIANAVSKQSFRQSYDSSNRPYGFGYIVDFNNATDINTYELNEYNTDGTLREKRTFHDDIITFNYDYLKRLEYRNVSDKFKVKYAYVDGNAANTTTNLVNGIRYLKGETTLQKFGYNYDELGNIKDVSDDAGIYASYTYDAQNQLIGETLNKHNLIYTYTYDTYGNIRSVTSKPISGGTTTTNTYAYGDAKWLDLLTAYNGSPITYDAIGNPLNYYNGATMSWVNGRRLASYTKSGQTTSYAYNAEGIRTRKTVNGVVHDYVLDGSRILADYSSGSELTFAYDENNTPISFKYNGTTYYYITNLQGDVVEIRDASGALVGSYAYNAWGKVIASSGAMANINPLRYRGYYYDAETGLYYLNSRYYDPQTGRFINSDIYASTGQSLLGCNMYAYCLNNPINISDPSGELALPLVVPFAALCIVAIVYFASPAARNSINGFVSAIVDGYTSLQNSISKWSTQQAANITSQKVAKAVKKIQLTVKQTSRTRYWSATLKKDYVDIGRSLTFNQAVKEVAAGRNVFTVTRWEAEAVARAAGGKVGANNKPLQYEIDKGKENIPGYYYHYHSYNRSGGHVFFLFF